MEASEIDRCACNIEIFLSRMSALIRTGAQKLISAVLILYAVSIMDGHSIMLETWNEKPSYIV